MVKLNLGCGIVLYKGWINVDDFFTEDELRKSIKAGRAKGRIEKGAKFVKANVLHLPFKDNYADFAMLDNVLEHISIVDVVPALKEIKRVLKPGGKLRIIVPYIDGLIMDYLDLKVYPFNPARYLEVMRTIMGGQYHEGEYHRSYFNVDFLRVVIATAGFVKGEIAILPKASHPPKEFQSIDRWKSPMAGAIVDYIVANVEK